MIVTKGDDGGIVEYGFLDEQADIHGGFRDAAMREAGSLDKLEVLVHHENPCFLCVEVLHLGEHVVVDGERRAQIGAIRVHREFGIDDADVINAIGCHVFGRMNMTKLDKILYVADKAEFTRTYEGVDKLRDMAKKDLNGAVLMTMNNSIGHLLARGIEPTDESLMIRQAIKRETENNKGDIK